jgi:predicted metalloprotease with PDZ domain
MRYATWLRCAVCLAATGITLSSSHLLSADGPAPPSSAKESKEAKQPDDGAEKPPGRVIIPKYRFGAALGPVPAKLNEELKLNGEGLIIDRVAPAGPAEKAGIKRGDILLAIGDRPIKKYGDSVEAANAAGPKTSIKLLRDGKPITVSITFDKHRKNDEKVFVPANPR